MEFVCQSRATSLPSSTQCESQEEISESEIFSFISFPSIFYSLSTYI